MLADNTRKLDSNGNKLDELLRGFASLNSRFEDIETRVSINSENIFDAGQRLNYLEQKALNSQMEINGLDATNVPYQVLKSEVIKFITDLGISVNPEHIVEVNKFFRTIGGNQQTIIIVTFMHEAIMRRVLMDKIKIDKQKGNCQVFFSDVLTRTNRQIFMAARQLKKQNQIFSAWTASGEIYIRTHEQSNKIKISSIEQLNEYNGNEQYSDESEYESIVYKRNPSHPQAHCSNQMTPPAISSTKPFMFTPKTAQDPRNKNQGTTSAQVFNYPATNKAQCLRPSILGNRINPPNNISANNSSKNVTANNLSSINSTANNLSSINTTANNLSFINNTANNSSSKTTAASNSETRQSYSQQKDPVNPSNTHQPQDSSLMLYDTPTLTASDGDHASNQMLLQFGGEDVTQDLSL